MTLRERWKPALLLIATALGLSATAQAATAVDYVEYRTTYRRVGTRPLPDGTRTYSVAVDAGAGIAADAITLAGLERVPEDGDAQVVLHAQPASIVSATLQHFDGTVSNTVDGRAAPQVFQYTIWWQDVVIRQTAEVSVVARGGTALASSGPIGAAWQGSFGKPEKISTGVFQSCGSPRCVMENEPVTSADAAAERLEFLATTFATDVTGNGRGIAAGGRDRAERQLAEVRAQLAAAPANAYSARTTQRANAWLDAGYGRGEGAVVLRLARVPSEPRLVAVIDGLVSGTAVDAEFRRATARDALRALVADDALKPRLRAAALFDRAVLDGIDGQVEDATRALLDAEGANAREPDGVFEPRRVLRRLRCVSHAA